MKVRKTIKFRAQCAWRSLQNWRHGYKFDAFQRYRCCDHTTPYHYGWCKR